MKTAKTHAVFLVISAVLLLPYTTQLAAALTDVESCAPIDCASVGGRRYTVEEFTRRVESAFRYCAQLDIEPQQCRACADGIYSQSMETADGLRCITRSHFRAAMHFCLAVVKEYNPPLGGTLDPALEDVRAPIERGAAYDVPLTGTRRTVVGEGTQSSSGEVLYSALLENSSMRFSGGCGVKWVTKPGYIIYPQCANLVCALYGDPSIFRNEVSTCCAERSHHLGGDNYLKNCWYTAE